MCGTMEADPVYVGGISRTVTYKVSFRPSRPSFLFQIKSSGDFSTEICQTTCSCDHARPAFLRRQIFFLSMKPLKRCSSSVFKSTLCVLLWLKARCFQCGIRGIRGMGEQSIRQTALQHILQEATPKIWMICKQISADWAAQRIRGFPGSAIKMR